MTSGPALVRGTLLALLAFTLPYLLGLRHVELAIAGLFLCAISLGLSLDSLFALVPDSERDCRHQLMTTVLSSFGLFLGCWIGLTLLALIPGENELWRIFAFVPEVHPLTTGHLGQGQFAALAEVLPHNFGVMATVVVLSIFYGNFGLSFGLTWNITLWTVVLVPLVARTVAVHSDDGVVAFVVSSLAIAPHVLTEFLAYLLAGLAAVHTRNAYLVAGGGGAVTPARLLCLLVALAAGGALLTAAAWFESRYTGAVLRLLPAG